MGFSIGVLNNIRYNASEEYQNRIPEATRDNIATIGNALQTYSVLYNEFCEALMNKIGKTLIEQKLFSNKLARFKQGTVLTQQDVEEIFIEMAKSEGAYDKDGKNPLGRRNPPDVKAVYHRQNRQDVYAVSIGDIDFVRVFRSEATLDQFVTGIINSVYSGAAYDEWVAMKELLGTYDGYANARIQLPNPGDPENMPPTPEVTMADHAKQFVKTVRKLVNDLSFPSKNYNKAGVMTWTNPEDLVLMVNKDLLAEIDVEVLSKAFNMGKTDVQVEIIAMDDFGATTEVDYSMVTALLVDKDFFRVYDTLSHFEPQRNAQGLFTNYFYHVHQILSLSPFKNAVMITAQ